MLKVNCTMIYKGKTNDMTVLAQSCEKYSTLVKIKINSGDSEVIVDGDELIEAIRFCQRGEARGRYYRGFRPDCECDEE